MGLELRSRQTIRQSDTQTVNNRPTRRQSDNQTVRRSDRQTDNTRVAGSHAKDLKSRTIFVGLRTYKNPATKTLSDCLPFTWHSKGSTPIAVLSKHTCFSGRGSSEVCFLSRVFSFPRRFCSVRVKGTEDSRNLRPLSCALEARDVNRGRCSRTSSLA